jgi:hypothetical protein
VLGAPSGAVPGYEEVGRHRGEFPDRRTDDRCERRATEVQPADEGVQRGHAGEALGVSHDVDRTRVPAAGQHHQSSAADMHDQGLVVDDQRVVAPLLSGPGLVGRRHAALEVGGAIDLARDEHAPVHQQ